MIFSFFKFLKGFYRYYSPPPGQPDIIILDLNYRLMTLDFSTHSLTVHDFKGLLKPRLKSEDVSLNMDKDAQAPPCLNPGHAWGEIFHNDNIACVGF